MGSGIALAIDVKKTVCLEQDHSQQIKDLKRLASHTLDFFHSSNGSNSVECFDLDPRDGFVRLAKTGLDGHRCLGSSHVQGMMSPGGNLHAILTRDGADSVLEVQRSGSEIRWSFESRGRLFEQVLRTGEAGKDIYFSQVSHPHQ